ncbi:MAG: glycosyltransferase family 39 protein [Pyrinomonadaceae bacterium]
MPSDVGGDPSRIVAVKLAHTQTRDCGLGLDQQVTELPGGEAKLSHCAERLRKHYRRNNILICLTLFLTSLSVRFLSWHDYHLEATRVQSVLTYFYKLTARLIIEGGLASLFSSTSALSNPDLMGHPPGYPIVLAQIFRLFGESNSAIQFFQIFCDTVDVILIFFIALELFPRSVALIAATLAALAPQFTYNSVMLLPDTLVMLPLLLCLYCLMRAHKRPRMLNFILAGTFIGLSCWLRANALLLAPFLAIVILFMFDRGRRLRFASAVLGNAFVVIAPLTVRNYIVFHQLIPVSLGAGQTLIEGIADYDRQKTFGLPATDTGLMRMEAELYGRPDYGTTLFGADGVNRDRLRLRRGFAIIRTHPLWFLSVMARRAVSMLRLERVPLISAHPPVSHSLVQVRDRPPVWSGMAAELFANAVVSAQTESRLSNGHALHLTGDNSKYGNQIVSPRVPVKPETDYLLRWSVKIERGRMLLNVIEADTNSLFTSSSLEPVEELESERQPVKIIELPFVTGRTTRAIHVTLTNGGATSGRPAIELGDVAVYELGPASYLWTRYPRLVIRVAQKLFISALLLPLVAGGTFLLLKSGKPRVLIVLLTFPAYYLLIQSALHTEYRYVMVIHYPFFILAALMIQWGGEKLSIGIQRLVR